MKEGWTSQNLYTPNRKLPRTITMYSRHMKASSDRHHVLKHMILLDRKDICLFAYAVPEVPRSHSMNWSRVNTSGRVASLLGAAGGAALEAAGVGTFTSAMDVGSSMADVIAAGVVLGCASMTLVTNSLEGAGTVVTVADFVAAGAIAAGPEPPVAVAGRGCV